MVPEKLTYLKIKSENKYSNIYYVIFYIYSYLFNNSWFDKECHIVKYLNRGIQNGIQHMDGYCHIVV